MIKFKIIKMYFRLTKANLETYTTQSFLKAVYKSDVIKQNSIK